MMRKLIYIGCCVAMMGCSGPSVPEVFTDSKELPKIYPDYTDVTIPVNMAPLTFELDEAADEMIARFAVGDEQIVCKDKAQPDAWQKRPRAVPSPSMCMRARPISGRTISLSASLCRPTASTVI